MEGLNPGVKPRWIELMTPLLMLWLILMSGCISTRTDKTSELMREHPKGFRDAVNASEESEMFVRECLRTIIDLEARLESR